LSPFTLAVFLKRLPPGFAGAAYRSTGSSVFNVAEGSGEARIGGICTGESCP